MSAEPESYLHHVMAEVDDPDTFSFSSFIVVISLFVAASLSGLGWWFDANLLDIHIPASSEVESN
jgi:hypothetical protein